MENKGGGCAHDVSSWSELEFSVAGVMWKGPENTFIEVGTEQQRHGLRKRSSGEYWSTTKNDSRMCQAGAATVQRSHDPES